MTSFYDKYKIHFEEFNLHENQFDNPSRLHGVMHSYRVMIHTLYLGFITGREKEARNAFFAAYIHDMARKHDGYCTKHGADAAQHKLPEYAEKFIKNGATQKDLVVIGKAVTLHSTGLELPKEDTDWHTVAILKDADAIDRIRLGQHDLNPSFLRYKETHNCISFGVKLYNATQTKKIHSLNELMIVALDASIETGLNA
ncbi:MAG: hypothetical protein M9948_05655 [Lentimicrobium sp.]|nr:hypothetical protein [Lentimicrobium sp.]